MAESPPERQPVVEFRQCSSALLRGPVEQDEQNLRGGLGVGGGVVPLAVGKTKMVLPIIQRRALLRSFWKQHWRQFGNVQKTMLQPVIQILAQATIQHPLVKTGMKGQKNAMASKLQQPQQGVISRDPGINLAGSDLMQQSGLADMMAWTKHRAFELIRHAQNACIYCNRTDGEYLVTLEIQTTGFQIEHNQACLVQRCTIDGLWRGQGFPALNAALCKYGRSAPMEQAA